jgi:hypothetical protein
MHETLLSCIDLQDTLSLVTGEDGLDSDALLAAEPIWLDEGTLVHDVSAFEEVAICIAGECWCFNFRGTFDV